MHHFLPLGRVVAAIAAAVVLGAVVQAGRDVAVPVVVIGAGLGVGYILHVRAERDHWRRRAQLLGRKLAGDQVDDELLLETLNQPS